MPELPTGHNFQSYGFMCVMNIYEKGEVLSTLLHTATTVRVVESKFIFANHPLACDDVGWFSCSLEHSFVTHTWPNNR
jgi:hypothetical protein